MNKSVKVLKGILLFVLSVTWCVLQTVIGALFALGLAPKSRFQKYRGMIIVYHPYSFTFSLGTFAFVSDGVEKPRTVRGRMYGHYAQSMIFGPLFLFVVTFARLIVRIPLLKTYRAERGKTPQDIYANRQAARLQARFGE